MSGPGGAIRAGSGSGSSRRRPRPRTSSACWTSPSTASGPPLTVGMSMRETENEINLLLPRQSLADISAAEGPAWAFGAPAPEPDDEDIPVTDELGETA